MSEILVSNSKYVSLFQPTILFHRFKNSEVNASEFDFTKCFKTEEQLSGSSQEVHYKIIYGKETNLKKKTHFQSYF